MTILRKKIGKQFFLKKSKKCKKNEKTNNENKIILKKPKNGNEKL